ncbi:MAG: hypothetical protein ACT4QC_07885 [Planctomycetaceae bacterium]
MVLSLGLVLIAIFEASKPANWEWLTRLSRDAPAAGRHEGAAPEIAEPQIDDALAPDQVRIVATEVPDDPPASANGPPDAGQMLRVPAQLLAAVRDDVVGVRHSEFAAYFSLLARAHDAPMRALERAGRSDISYAALMNDTERYRGELVTLAGELRRLTRLTPGENDAGIEALFDGWMFTDDAGRRSPYRFVCSEKPVGFPEGDEVRERVQFTGYFFKRVSYETAHGLHSAPMLLGRTFRWVRQPAARPAPGRSSVYFVLALAALALSFAATSWKLLAGGRRLRTVPASRSREPTAEDLEALGRVESIDAKTFLSELARNETQADSDQGAASERT